MAIEGAVVLAVVAVEGKSQRGTKRIGNAADWTSVASHLLSPPWS